MSINQPFNTPLLIWSSGFAARRSQLFSDTQKFIDSECIRYLAPYTPMRNGFLVRAATIGTKIGSGLIRYSSPYARYQYYGKLMVSSVTGSAYARRGESKELTGIDLKYDKTRHPNAQRLWFEAMKADKKKIILRDAARYMRK